MKVLLITKKTNHEILEGKVKSQSISDPGFLKNLRQSHEEHIQALDKLRDLLSREGVQCTELSRGMSWPRDQDFDCIITLGGDGTILSSSHQISQAQTPILGIRSSEESVGFLCALNHKNLEKLPGKLSSLEKETTEVERLSALVTFQKNGKTLQTPPILNDFLFANLHPASTSRYELRLNETHELHKSSGIWISTPSGSTAAIGTIGAQVQDLSDICFQYKVRELYPNPSHFKLSGGLFNPDVDQFEIINYNNDAILAVDGQHGSINLTIGDSISFKRANPLLLFSPSSASYSS